MSELILPINMKQAEEPVKKNDDTKPGVVAGLVFLFLGVLVFSYPFIVQGMADSAKIGITQRAMAAMREHPEKKIKTLDYATPGDIALIKYARGLDITISMCIVLSFFILFPLGLFCIYWSAMGCSDMTIGELAASGAIGYVGYKVVKKILK